MSEAVTYKDKQLTYASTSRCPCGAGLAHPRKVKLNTDEACWDCSDILTGRAKVDVIHTARLPFVFYEIKSENQPSAKGATTRAKS